MKKVKYLFCLFCFGGFWGNGYPVIAQDLAALRWEKRLLLVHVGDTSSTQLVAQLADWAGAPAELEDRQIAVCQVQADWYRWGWDTAVAWRKRDRTLSLAYAPRADFEVVLIGLDAGVKLRQPELLDRESLLARIDGMPMRRAELRRRARER
ncbi:MAG: DUF4174 domain-containing protein [Bacteroidota bacterium]